MSKKCEHCKGELVPHEGSRDGLFHCDSCGCCFLNDKATVRPGHPVCNYAGPDAKTVAEESFELVAEEDSPKRTRRK